MICDQVVSGNLLAEKTLSLPFKFLNISAYDVFFFLSLKDKRTEQIMLTVDVQMVAAAEPNAESFEFSRVCDMDGDFEPVDGGLKNESGKFLKRNGIWSGRASWFSATSNNACKLTAEFSSTRTTRCSLAADVGVDVAMLLIPVEPIFDEFNESSARLLVALLFAADTFELFTALLILFNAIVICNSIVCTCVVDV